MAGAAGASLLCLPVRSAWSADAIAELKAFSANTSSARGEFSQQLLKGGRQGMPAAQGEFAFARPGRFRWDIRKPYEQLILTDGRRLYFYDKDLRQVTIRPAGEVIKSTPAAVLFGGGDLDAAFQLTARGPHDDFNWVEARPRQADSGFDQILIGLRDGLPLRMEVRDAFGQITRFDFSRLSRNGAVNEADFRFTPPAGVDVIE